MKDFIKKLSSPVYLQVIFWIILYFLDVQRMTVFYGGTSIYYTALFEILCYAFIINLNIFILIPKLYYKKNYVTYIVSVLLLVSITSHLLGWLESTFYLDKIPISDPIQDNMKHIKRGMHVFKAMPLMGLLFLTTIYTFGKRRDEKQKQFKEEKTKSELQLLKSQINPHFLFNALNSVYTLSYIKSEMTPQMILKLSEMLRYVLYECTSDKVTLEKELIYLENYITFQNLKEESAKSVSVDFSEVDENILVAPMLFVPFVENSFKHSNISTDDAAHIKIKMASKNNVLYFYVENSISDNTLQKSDSNGIGLENVKRRLDLIYENQYKLQVDETKNLYKINLELELP